jgi:membrane protein implicated in regulation of membrane protease activity
MAVHAEPSPEAGAAPSRERWAVRFRGLGSREKWGYVVWSLVGVIIAIPEIWAAAGSPPWPTISATVGHLETLWNPVALLVVALIAAAAVHAVRYPWHRTGEIRALAGRQRRGRTENGRITKTPDDVSPVPIYAYFTLAVAAIVVGSVLAVTLSSSRWVLAYVLYGLVAIFCIITPNILAFWFKRDVPFPTLFRTVADIEHRWYPAALVIVVGLVVLLIHLAFYPWPDIFRHVTTNSP